MGTSIGERLRRLRTFGQSDVVIEKLAPLPDQVAESPIIDHGLGLSGDEIADFTSARSVFTGGR